MYTRYCPLLITFIATLTLTACQSTSEQAKYQLAPMNLLDTQGFKVYAVESQEEIFRLDPELNAHLDAMMLRPLDGLSKAKRLLNFLMDNGDASLSYQSGANLTASEAYHSQNANCLSLSILAYSIAQKMGLQTQFQRVLIPEYWDQSQGYSLLTGHVNLKVVKKRERSNAVVSIQYNAEESLTVDFDPNSRQQRFRVVPISKERITAMYYNNKGAKALLDHDLDSAFSYFKAAVDIDTSYSGAWGNLGVLLRVSNHLSEAEQAYQYAITLDANDTAYGNLALLYYLTNREELAKPIEARLAAKRDSNPYYHILLGNEAFDNADYSLALAEYRKARSLDSSLHNSYFGLAKTFYTLGDAEQARHYLQLALKHADFEHDKLKYDGKLRFLNATAKN
ncbi:tetratricopeptide repeat protein [Pseudoalteromonas fenneropenaei]|uniref:Tetratricopeptide repeat protein n=1 Tax=Pseudoalteromonas fenneropenaei TaxID=1737459 RepID=A0ABV7CI81_9GAMM